MTLAYLALVAAAVTAIAFARREREHRPVAVLLLVNLAASLARSWIAPHVDATPLGLALFHLDEALFLAGPCSLAATALVMLSRPRLVLLAPTAWALVVANLIVYGDALDAEALARVYLAVELAALLVCVAAGAGATRAGKLDLRRLPHLTLAMIVGVEALGVVLGPWRYGIWVRWDLAQLAQVALYGVLTLLQGGALVLERNRRP